MEFKFYKLDEESEKLNLLKLIKKYGTVTRGQIVTLTGYSSAKIGLLIKEMEEQNLLEEIGDDESTGGRKAKLLQLRGNKGYFLGIELGGYEQKISIIDFSGKMLAYDKIPEISDHNELGMVIDTLVEFIHKFINLNSKYTSGILGIGLAVSGVVDNETGVCRYYRNKKSWEGIELKSILEKEFSMPCVIDDSSRMMAVAEKVYGSCHEIDNFILVSIGVGIGAGIYINGRLFRGSGGLAGEIGHMVIKENGPRCVCGNYGCLESLASGYAIERQLQEALKDNVYSSIKQGASTAKEVVDQAKLGDKLAYSIINNAAKHLGVGIANVINIFNPEVVILSGGISKAGELLTEPIEQVVKSSALEFSAKNCKIIISQLNEYAAALGVANVCIDKILETNLILKT